MMCGRTAYSSRACAAAAELISSRSSDVDSADVVHRNISNEIIDNPNASPGTEYCIFRRSSADDHDIIELCRGIWGLIPNQGTKNSPHLLPSDNNYSLSQHYKMFNARSETLYDKRSFSGLISKRQTCILSVDGYYEWVTQSQQLSDKKKQPYFVCYKNRQKPLLLAGLWCCVKTGRQIANATTSEMEDETLTTFTILTTDAHPQYSWLHPRQPVILWNDTIATEWLMNPSTATVNKLQTVPINGEVTEEGVKQPSIWENELSIYPVSKKVNDGKYKGDDCTVEVKLEKVPSIKSFFSPSSKKAKTENATKKTNNSLTSATKMQVAADQKQALVMKREESQSKSEENDIDEMQWTCSACTYIHTGPMKFDYLACEICGSERKGANHTDHGKKRKAN